MPAMQSVEEKTITRTHHIYSVHSSIHRKHDIQKAYEDVSVYAMCKPLGDSYSTLPFSVGKNFLLSLVTKLSVKEAERSVRIKR
jgi:hypothetical protein